MANEMYKGHLLISTARYNSKKKSWVVKIHVSWSEGGKFYYHFVDEPSNLYTSEEDAVSQGLLLARQWVDKKQNGKT
jgi:hypothetical protein